MADRPILFSAPMVRALLAGTKTQTRRLLTEARVFATPEAKAFTLRGDDLTRALQNASRFRHLDGNGWFWEADAFEWQTPALRTGWMAHIGYAPGDRLWVRESWWSHAEYDDLAPSGMGGEEPVKYEADGACQTWGYPAISQIGRLRASMHMPRWASRLTLIVTDVRVQRLQDISEDDARAEGVEDGGCLNCGGSSLAPEGCSYAPSPSYRDGYAALWTTINGHGSWEANPWVAAYTFTAHRQNIDALETSQPAEKP